MEYVKKGFDGHPWPTKGKKTIKNSRDGFRFNSKRWQDYKASLPSVPPRLQEIAVGMVFGDATMYRVSREAYIKFEQGHQQKPFVDHLFDEFKVYCFMEAPGIRFFLSDEKRGQVKSLWFKTFSHKSFTAVWEIFYSSGKKSIQKGLLANHLTARGLAYWIMCDGSLQKNKKSLVLHTQGYTEEENFKPGA